MDLLDRRAVNLGLGFGQPPKNPAGQILLPIGKLAAIDHCRDVVQMPVGMLGRMFDRDVQRAKSLSLDLVDHDPAAGQPERIDARLNLRQISAGIDERGQRHVAADSARTVEIGNFHPRQYRPMGQIAVCLFQPDEVRLDCSCPAKFPVEPAANLCYNSRIMSRVDLNQALTPSILDRLVDPDSTGTAARSGYGVEQVIFSVRRDLEDLLNTHRSIIHLPEEFPEILKSPVGYGIPDFASLATATVKQRETIGRMVEEIITRFEPRLREVNVHVIDDNRGVDHHLSVRFQIEARLRVEPYPDISFETVMELTTGCTQIRTMKT